MDTFAFRFDPRYRAAGALFGVAPRTARVDVSVDRLTARFGPWVVDTALVNIVDMEVTGPFTVPKTIGPARLSFADRGLTMATNADAGLCMRFRTPVRGIDPIGWIRHPALTVTVERIDDLRRVIEEQRGAAPG